MDSKVEFAVEEEPTKLLRVRCRGIRKLICSIKRKISQFDDDDDGRRVIINRNVTVIGTVIEKNKKGTQIFDTIRLILI